MSKTVFGLPRSVAVTVIRGGAPGEHQTAGHIRAGDVLISVRHVSADLATSADLTAEFSISGPNALANTGGTDTSGDFLVVTYAKAEGA